VPLIIWVYLHGGLRKTTLFLQDWCFGRSRSSEVIDFGTSRKRVRNFLLVRHSSWSYIEPFRRYCRTKSPMLGSVWAAVKLFSKYCNLCEKKTYLNVTDEQTDRRTESDGQTTYCCITALCVASRGKNASALKGNYKDRFWWRLAKCSKDSRIEFACFSFSVGLPFYQLFVFPAGHRK